MTELEKTELYEEFSGKVRAYLGGRVNDADLAEDLCSEVFLKVTSKNPNRPLKKLPKYSKI